MAEWRITACVLCAQNCGLEVFVDDNRILKVRPDKSNPRSQGYACRKGLNIAYHQHHAQRLTHPLKKVDGAFQQISWDQAFDEIAKKLRGIVNEHGPRALAYMGGGGQGSHFQAAFALRLLHALGSQYHYSALAQELTGNFWAQGRVLGRQYLFTLPDHATTDLMLAIGWNGWMSHQMPQARRWFEKIARDPKRLLIVVDPHHTETTRLADIHLALRPGTDALLTRAMIAIILQEGWQNRAYIEQHVTGFEQIESWFKNFDAHAAVRVCELEYEQVREVARLFATRQSSLHNDLGVFMNRHSTATTYLHTLLLAVCGRIGVRGGNVIPGYLTTLGVHSDERKARTWRTVATNFPAILGTFPPNVMPEEILSDHPERLRAVIVSNSNPLRSYADTTAYENAFAHLDLLVTFELAMTETAALSHYVLPARSAFESWDGSFFAWTFPEIFFQMRRPVVEPIGEPLEDSEILVRLADRLGIVPTIPDSLHEAARQDRMTYGLALMAFAQDHPEAVSTLPFVVAKTLGSAMGSVNRAALWAMLQIPPRSFRENAVRIGFPDDLTLGDAVFDALMEHPEGLWVGKCDPENNLAQINTKDGKLQVHIPEMEEWVCSIDASSEQAALGTDAELPFILQAGRHNDTNANTLMRDAGWNKGRRVGTLAMHPDDAAELDLIDGQPVQISTEAGSVNAELELSAGVRRGVVVMPHGFGLEYEGHVVGANVNRLTKNTHRDPLAATPLHRYIRCRVDRVSMRG
ncbi:MAG: molybdopterin-dependent oxidoreductase [Chloroflexi bacterium]|nr:molybdopterin-dependent oxidoreductase [Chloroflexota bacterium]